MNFQSVTSPQILHYFIFFFVLKDTPDSPKDESHSTLEPGRGEKEGKRQSRHLLFTTHFPLPQVMTFCLFVIIYKFIQP